MVEEATSEEEVGGFESRRPQSGRFYMKTMHDAWPEGALLRSKKEFFYFFIFCKPEIVISEKLFAEPALYPVVPTNRICGGS